MSAATYILKALAGAAGGYAGYRDQQKADLELKKKQAVEAARWQAEQALRKSTTDLNAELARAGEARDAYAFGRKNAKESAELAPRTAGLSPDLRAEMEKYDLPVQTDIAGMPMQAGLPLDPASTTGTVAAMRGWETPGEAERTFRERVVKPAQMAAAGRLPEHVRPWFEAQIEGLPISSIGGLSAMTPEQQLAQKTAEAKAEADQAIRVERVRNEGRASVPSASGFTPQQVTAMRTMRTSLRAEPAYRSVAAAQDAIAAANSALDMGTGAGDITAINLIQRGMVDPGVAVREGDVALLQKASPFFAKFFSQFPIDRLSKGAILPQEARDELRRVANMVVREKASSFERGTANIYRRQAEAAGIPFENVYEGSQHILEQMDAYEKLRTKKDGETWEAPSGAIYAKGNGRVVKVQ